MEDARKRHREDNGSWRGNKIRVEEDEMRGCKVKPEEEKEGVEGDGMR